ncbi:MAG: VRR-NUC domain-containing protein [Lachnospiraceae bacterium]|nr:VRR-NUC domain-containing protein [Lachnospiraceae bacterium]
MRENYIEKRLRLQVLSRGGLCEKWNAGSAGWPDRIVLLPDGKIGFVELKAPGKLPRQLQLHRHVQLQRLGFPVFVLDDVDEIGGVLDAIQTS